MRRTARLLIGLAALASLAACNIQQSVDDANAAISTFHADLDAGRMDAIWSEASPEMKAATSKAQLTALLSAVHRKLGRVQQSEQRAWNSNATTNGSFVVVQMATTFERGTGMETFTYRKGDNDQLALVGYNIQSNEMMLN
jgi:hypothetical protein